MLPIMLDARGKRVLVVGAGGVGRRKALNALAAGATVRLVAPEPLHEEFVAHTAVEWVQASYHARHLEGMALVFAAATRPVNEQVTLDAIRRGVWVNSATDPTAGDFIMPAVVRQGELTLAVSAGGAAPALARRIRERLAADFDEHFATWIGLLEEIRPQVRETVRDPEQRRALLDDLADWPWLARLKADGRDATWAAMVARVRAV